jgi:hypothetical protein
MEIVAEPGEFEHRGRREKITTSRETRSGKGTPGDLRGGKAAGIRTEQEGTGKWKSSGEDLTKRCYREFTKLIHGIYTRGTREKRAAFSVGLPDRKKELRRRSA